MNVPIFTMATTDGVVLVLDGISLKGTVWRNRLGHVVEAKPWAHNPNCNCKPHQTFTCDRCGRRVGYCLGCDDNMPGACDFCWKPPEDP